MELNRPLILASSSPRRQFLMKEAGFQFKIEKPDVEELFPESLPPDQVAKYLASLKAEFFRSKMTDEIIITADTVVILNNRILNKPASRNEAVDMLSALSGNTHRVMTGVTILSKERKETFHDTTDVTFEVLSNNDIEFYVDHFHPYDKAGAYGAQDCLPAGMNPCSREEMEFLKSIGKENLIDGTITDKRRDRGVVIIKRISGSYFNVMGLPIHLLFQKLCTWQEDLS